MGFLENKVVIAKCPACEATTKVTMEPGRMAIRCPRCKRQVPLTYARSYTAQRAAPPETRAERAVSPEPPAPAKETRKAAAAVKPPRRGQSATATEVHYPDHSWSFVRWSFGVGGVIVAVAVLLIGYLIWRDAITSRHQEYFENMNEAVSKSKESLALLKSMTTLDNDSPAAAKYKSLKADLDFLATRRRHIASPNREQYPEIKALGDELATLQGQTSKLEQQLRKPAPPVAAKTVSVEAVSPNLGQTMLGGPPKAPSEKPVPVIPKVTDTATVLVILPGVTTHQVTEAFLKRFAGLADNQAGQVTPKWSGDLLSLEIKPVANPALFATKVEFGKLIYLSLSDRSITMQLDQDRVVNERAAAKDPLNLILADLKQREKFSKLMPALLRLADIKADRRQAEVTAVLVLLINQTDLDLKIREQAVKLMPAWGGRDAVPLLEKYLDDKAPLLRWAALDALVELRSSKSAPLILKNWTKPEVDRIGRALVALGPDVEISVLPFLHNTPETSIRVEACRVLKEIGSTQSLKPLLDVISSKDQPPAVVNAAREAMAAILNRDSSK